MITVLLVDDHAVIRRLIRTVLELEPGITVVGEAETGEDGVRLAAELTPDVAVVDLSMPGINGLEATRRILGSGAATRVLILTAHADEEYLMPVIDAGASGYLNKATAHEELPAAIRAIARGEAYLPASAAVVLLRAFQHAGAPSSGELARLTPREREVLAATAEGFSASEVGDQLSISAKTVETHRARIMEKLGLNHRSQLVQFALRTGLLKRE